EDSRIWREQFRTAKSRRQERCSVIRADMEPVEEGLPSGGILRIARRVGFYRHDRRLLIDGRGILRALLVIEDVGIGVRGVFASCRTRGHPLSQRRVARRSRN